MYTCPVCAYDALKEAPFGAHQEPSYEICPCCGFEFGFSGDNDQKVFEQYRLRWIKEGMPWFVEALKPSGWTYKDQLKEAQDG